MNYIKSLPNNLKTNTEINLKCNTSDLISHPFMDPSENPSFFIMIAKELGFDYIDSVAAVYPNNITISGKLMDIWVQNCHNLEFKAEFLKKFLEYGPHIDPSQPIDTILLRENAFIFRA